ncbi:hypothetical protein [Candidatus Enterococcus ferrettii]|uniref:Alternate signal-mediated exported protein n=1 Tax=Candidatus Enterococcus ferrettii TaxID=2815324 RepID=A0ABV0EMZ8_9ENTE|nr:hypothetical protein [Enterococcus sp. 665A]MBO1339797.1 hypothetical protein [Enterococcus sp. 665A]
MKERKKKKLLAIAALLALIAVVSGTFAWITSQQQKINRVQSSAIVDDSVVVNEVWEPKPMLPGTETTKEVSVSNTGNANVFVRVSYEEVLKHLVSEGAVTYSASTVAGAKYDPDAAHTLTSHVPVAYSAEKISVENGFSEVDDPSTQVNGLEADTKLFVKGGQTIDPSTGKITTSYEAVVVHEYAPGEFQAMEYEVAVDERGANNRSESATEWTFTVSKLTYGYYAGGYENSVVNWAASSLAPKGETTVTGHALLGTSGKQGENEYDYTEAGLGIVSPATLPNPTPTSSGDLIPTANNENKGVQADRKGFNKDQILIGYGDAIVGIDALEEGKWVYNSEDGWFYYTVPLLPQAKTPDLLKKLIFGKDMSVEYTNATYDLIVKMEAIQATEAAIKDADAWDLGGAAEDSPTDKIVNYLVSKIPN